MIENVSTQLTVFHCFAHCLLPGRAFASLYALLFLEKEAEIGGRDVTCVRNLRTFTKVGMFRLITSNSKHFRKDTCVYFKRVS